jgi:hypothetical protein
VWWWGGRNKSGGQALEEGPLRKGRASEGQGSGEGMDAGTGMGGTCVGKGTDARGGTREGGSGGKKRMGEALGVRGRRGTKVGPQGGEGPGEGSGRARGKAGRGGPRASAHLESLAQFQVEGDYTHALQPGGESLPGSLRCPHCAAGGRGPGRTESAAGPPRSGARPPLHRGSRALPGNASALGARPGAVEQPLRA